MGTVAALFQFLLCFTASALTQAPLSPPSFAGVFLLIDGGKYTYSFADGTLACRTLNATVATLAQVERALQHGLETCKYGWTAEQTSVIPRLTANKNCGQGKTGVVTWSANPNKKFGVFCFSAPDSDEAPATSTRHFSPSSTWTTPSSSSSSSPSSVSTNPPSAPTAGAPVATTPTASPFSPSDLTGSTSGPITSRPTSPPPSAASVPEQGTCEPADAGVATSSFSSSSFLPAVSTTLETTATWTASPAKPFLGGVSRTLLVLGVVLLLLTAAALVSYYKLNVFSFWPAGRLKDDVEREMWKHDDSETDLPSQPEEEDEEDRKDPGDIPLCVNPTFRSDSSLA